MKQALLLPLFLLSTFLFPLSSFPLSTFHSPLSTSPLPWDHGRLVVSENRRFLMHQDGTPFFWQGETAWLMPQRLNGEEVHYYLERCAQAGYNVVQMQLLNDMPSYNIYGQSSDEEDYWQHVDYIVSEAAAQGLADRKSVV